jgi:SAM-dependent methyltransferase
MPKFDPVLGIFAPEVPWIPTIAHIIRRAAIFDAIRNLHVGRVLEVGCGAGAFLCDLHKKGYSGKGIDTSQPALDVAQYIHSEIKSNFQIEDSLANEDRERYDYVMAFEVLEHIKNDIEAIQDWKAYLKPGGKLIFSVPAHRRMWGASDQWAGHVRRYDLPDLHNCLNSAGFKIDSSYCYGFPILNLLAPISNFVCKIKSARRNKNTKKIDISYATSISGTDRVFESKIFFVYSNIFAKLVFRFLFLVQRKFYSLAWGSGYIVVASEQAPLNSIDP